MLDTLLAPSPLPANNETSSRSIIDCTGQEYVLSLSPNTILLDGCKTTVNAVTQQTIHCSRSSQPSVCGNSQASSHTEDIAFPTEAFWYACIGATQPPTPEEAGMVLAQSLLYYQQLAQIIGDLAHLFSQQTAQMHEREQAMHGLLLPPERMDPFTARVLERYDGSETSLSAITLILGQPQSQIAALLARAGHSMQRLRDVSEPEAATLQAVNSPLALPTSPMALSCSLAADSAYHVPAWAERTPAEETEELGQAMSSPQFRWTEEMVQHLRDDFNAYALVHPPLLTNAIAQTIAAQRQWPTEKVTYKIHQLGLSHKHKGPHHVNSSGQSTPVVEPAATPETTRNEATETGRNTSTLTPSSTPVTEQKALSSVSEDVLDVPDIDVLALPALPSEVQGIRPPSMVEPLALTAGPFLWNVEIDGAEQKRWRLGYPYGDFPPVKAGERLLYQSQEYILRSAWHSTVAVSSALRLAASLTDQC